MRAAIEAVDGRAPVLSCVAETSTAAACRYARDMEALGADGLMVLPAMVYRADEREAVAHFRAVARASGLPIIVYNNPVAYNVDLTPRALAELSDQPTLVALKDSAGDVRRLTDVINEVGDRYTIFCGVDDLVAGKRAVGRRRDGSRASAWRSRRRTSICGTWPLADSGRRRAKSTAGHAAPAPRRRHQVRAKHQACHSRSRSGNRTCPPPATAAQWTNTRICPRHDSAWNRKSSVRKLMDPIRVIDSHTGGEPTRVVLPGQIELVGETMSERLTDFRSNHDHFRTATMCEPVALKSLSEPSSPRP